MKNEVIAHVRSGGRQISLYAELGSYFTPDGELREKAFRKFIRSSLAERSAEQEAGQWLSEYLDHVLGYLEEKGMGGVTLGLFEAAIDESAQLGIDEVSVSPNHMRVMLAQRNVIEEPEVPTKSPVADGKRAAILEAALDVFTARGFHNAKMDEIASKSGVAKGTLYRYFTSKDDLLDQLLSKASMDIMVRFGGVLSGSETVVEQIQAFIEQWVGYIEENHAIYRLIQSEGSSFRGGDKTVFYEVLIRNLPMVKERVVSMDEGSVLKTTSFHTVVYGTFGFIDGIVHKWLSSGMNYPLTDEIPSILEVLFHGFVRDHESVKVFFVPPDDAEASSDETLDLES